MDVHTQLGTEVGVELAHGVPPLVAHGGAGVDAEGVVAVVDEGCIEASDGLQFAVDEAEVELDEAPCAGSYHDASVAGTGVEELAGSGLTAALGLAEVGAHVGLVGLVAAEELGNLLGDGRQHAAVGQFVADAEVGVGADVHLDDCGVELQELEEAALVLGRFADVQMPLGRGVFLSVLGPSDLQFEADPGLQGRDAAILLLLFLLFFGEFGLVVVGSLAVRVLFVVAGETSKAGFGVRHPLVDLLGIQFFLEILHLGLQGIEGRIGLGDLVDERLGVEAGIQGEVEAEVAVLALAADHLILIDE